MTDTVRALSSKLPIPTDTLAKKEHPNFCPDALSSIFFSKSTQIVPRSIPYCLHIFVNSSLCPKNAITLSFVCVPSAIAPTQ